MSKCESCEAPNVPLKTAVVDGKYYKGVCGRCLHDNTNEVSSNAVGFDRRRQYEDFAQDTVQPYDAAGPNVEFYRLYPEAAAKVFSPEVIDKLKHKL